VGPLLRDMRYPGKPDLLLNLGNRHGERAAPGMTLISMRNDPASLARTAPVDLGMVSDLRLGIVDLIEAIRAMAPEAKLKQIAQERFERTSAHTKEMREFRQKIILEHADRSPVSMERIGLELERALPNDAIYVADTDSGRQVEIPMSFGGGGKEFIGTGPNVLGWGMAAAFGAKLARPNQPVVAAVGDGSFLFSGPQPLWTQARYKAPVMNIVLNNKSYNNERNRIWHYGGRQFKTGRDMTCYLGSPDVDYAKTSMAFGVEAENVKEPGQLKGAIARAQKAIEDGRPYLLDIDTYRDGVGAASTWHSPYSIADKRTRRV
jgi:thiamine pyrophosphate-dependent acetolactate synthase large subunit-like protein